MANTNTDSTFSGLVLEGWMPENLQTLNFILLKYFSLSFLLMSRAVLKLDCEWTPTPMYAEHVFFFVFSF